MLSHPDISHIGALPYAMSKLGLKADVFGTIPLYKMGHILLKILFIFIFFIFFIFLFYLLFFLFFFIFENNLEMFMYDAYQSRINSEEFALFDLDDVDAGGLRFTLLL